MKKLMIAVLAAGVMSVAMAGSAMAEEATFKFNESFSLPNHVLAPGTYTFKTVNDMGAVAVEDESGNTIAMFLTIHSANQNAGNSKVILKDGRAAYVEFGQSGEAFQFIY